MIFTDLDNTLYNQGQYLKLIFRKIGEFLEKELKINSTIIYNYLLNTAKTKTMNYPIFNSLIKEFKLNISSMELIELYRRLTINYLENNKIILYKGALHLLENHDVIIYTEGRREIQEIKIRNIERNYKLKLKYIIVEDKLKEKNMDIFNKYSPSIYIGDDVFRDFLIPNKLGILTIRVLTGLYKDIPNNIVDYEYRPKTTLRNLSHLKL